MEGRHVGLDFYDLLIEAIETAAEATAARIHVADCRPPVLLSAFHEWRFTRSGFTEGHRLMSKAQYAQRRDGRVSALQYLYAWSINPPENLIDDLRVFFEGQEQPREH